MSVLNRKNVAINAIASSVQLLVSAASIFVLYKYLFLYLGAENIGIWSLVLSMSTMVRLSDMGFTGSVIKFVAEYEETGDRIGLSKLADTSIISISLFSLLLSFVIFPLSVLYLESVLDGESLSKALLILPVVIPSIWFFMVSGVYHSVMYGCELIVHRNALMVFDSLSYLAGCILVVPKYGINGLVWCRLVQNILTLLLTIAVLKMKIPEISVVPRRWDKLVFKKIFKYALNFQVIAVLVMLTDPITKGFLSRYGSVSFVGYYEMARKLVQLLSAMLTNANQVLVPRYSRASLNSKDSVVDLYAVSYRSIFYFAVPAFALLAVSAPLVSQLWLGDFRFEFVVALIVLAAGWLFNVLAVPAYHAGMGVGVMRANVISHFLMVISNILLSFVLGVTFGGVGVVVAWSASLMISAAYMLTSYHQKNNLSFKKFVPSYSLAVLISSLIGLLISYAAWLNVSFLIDMLKDVDLSDYITACIAYAGVSLIFVVIVVVPVWNHPVRKAILNMVTRKAS